jgi:hypothetical protein
MCDFGVRQLAAAFKAAASRRTPNDRPPPVSAESLRLQAVVRIDVANLVSAIDVQQIVEQLLLEVGRPFDAGRSSRTRFRSANVTVPCSGP